jgi:glucosamine 6-phosphate synthetase-like amidotransferase/phosphosugar isomerase protein
MSVATLQQAPLRVKGQLAVAFSQSGKSPDLVGTMQALRAAGALTVAAVNVPGSPLAEACEWSLPLLAGPELSVAATKSYIAMLSLSAIVIAHVQKDVELLNALKTLPDALRAAGKLDWSHAVDELKNVDRMIVIGRGLGLAIAQEAALKLKETSGIQAEAFSSAEVRHGPMELIGQDYPLLVFAPRGPEQAGLIQLARCTQCVGQRLQRVQQLYVFLHVRNHDGRQRQDRDIAFSRGHRQFRPGQQRQIPFTRFGERRTGRIDRRHGQRAGSTQRLHRADQIGTLAGLRERHGQLAFHAQRRLLQGRNRHGQRSDRHSDTAHRQACEVTGGVIR